MKYLKLIAAPFLGMGLLTLTITPIYLLVIAYVLRDSLPIACIILNIIFAGFDLLCFVAFIGILISNSKQEDKL